LFLFGFISSPFYSSFDSRVKRPDIYFPSSYYSIELGEMNHGRRAFLICNQIDKQERTNQNKRRKEEKEKQLKKFGKRQP
jgi:hypothetical protein